MAQKVVKKKSSSPKKGTGRKNSAATKASPKVFIGAISAIVIIIVAVVLVVVFNNKGGGDGTVPTTTEGSGFVAPTTAYIPEDYSFIISDTSLFIKRDGSILSAEVEGFENDYYSTDEFEQKWLAPEVSTYNSAKQGINAAYAKDSDTKLGVAINSLTLSGTSLVLQMDYATPDDYLAFNKQVNVYFANWGTFRVLDLADLESTELKLTDKEGNETDINSLKSNPYLHVCIVGFNGTMPSGFTGKFNFEGAVKYVSEGVSITDANAVRLHDSNDLQYIIFE